jgi:hypothetical protein
MLSLIFFFFIKLNSCLFIGTEECNEMIKAIECFPDYDKNLFNLIFSRLYDVQEVKLLQAKGLDYFGMYYSIGNIEYCHAFQEMTSFIEKKLAYDIYTRTRGSGSRETSKINHPKMVENGWYESLIFIRLLPNEISSKCKLYNSTGVSLNDGTKKQAQQDERNEMSIIQCINNYRRQTLKLSIVHRLNNFSSLDNDYNEEEESHQYKQRHDDNVHEQFTVKK